MDGVTLAELENFLEPDMDGPGEAENLTLEAIIFHPKDREIIKILESKRKNPEVDLLSPIFEQKIYDHEPSEIPGLPVIQTGGKWWNFFCEPIPLPAGRNGCFSRSTRTGYWKATGNPVKIKSKGSDEVIGEKRTLVFHIRYRGVEERTNWVMHEYSANDNPLFKKHLVICRIKLKKDKLRRVSIKNENKRGKRPLISTNNEGRSKQRRISTKNKNKQAKKHPVAADNGNEVAEKSSLGSQLLPNCQDVAQIISPQPQLQPSCNLISNPTSAAAENACPSVSNYNNHAIEDTSQVDPYPPTSNSDNHDIEYTSLVELLSQNPNGSAGPDHTIFSALQSLLPEQGSSYDNVSSNENYSWNYFGSGFDSLQQFAWVSPADEFLPQFLEETGHYSCSSFVTPLNEVTRGFCGGDSSNVGTETLHAKVNEGCGFIPLEHV